MKGVNEEMESNLRYPFALISALGFVAITAGRLYLQQLFHQSPVLAKAKVSQEGGVTVKAV